MPQSAHSSNPLALIRSFEQMILLAGLSRLWYARSINRAFEPMSAVPAILAAHGVLRRDAATWRIVNPSIRGEITGLPSSRGNLVATNGLLCIIERYNQPSLLGHFQHFVPDRDETTPPPPPKRNTSAGLLAKNLIAEL